jgi:hypothetical protein
VPVGRLREGLRARKQIAVDEDDQRPERNVLREREAERQATLIHVEALPDRVEDDAEQSSVRCVQNEAERAVAAAEELHVRVVAPENTLVERFL